MKRKHDPEDESNAKRYRSSSGDLTWVLCHNYPTRIFIKDLIDEFWTTYESYTPLYVGEISELIRSLTRKRIMWRVKKYTQTDKNEDFFISEPIKKQTQLMVLEGAKEFYAANFITNIVLKKISLIGISKTKIATVSTSLNEYSFEERLFFLEIRKIEKNIAIKRVTQSLPIELGRKIYFFWIAKSFYGGSFKCFESFNGASLLWGEEVFQNMIQEATK